MGHTLSITDAARGTTLTGQDHTINPNVMDAPAATGDMHHAFYHATAAAYDINSQTDSPEGTPTGTPCTITGVIHP